MADIRYTYLFYLPGRTATGSVTNFALNGATDALTWIFDAPDSGPVLTVAAIRVSILTGSSPTYVLSLQGVDSSGYADGTIKSGSGSNDVYVELTPLAGHASTVQTYTFGGGGYNSSPGELLALNLAPKGGTTIDGSNNWSFSSVTGFNRSCDFPYAVQTDAGTPTKQFYGANFAVGDGTNWWGGELAQQAGYVTIGSSPVNAGAKFTIPAGVGDTVSCVGTWYHHYGTTGKTHRFSLYNSSDTLLAQTDRLTDKAASLTDYYPAQVLWDDGAISLTCGSTYRLVQTCTDGTTRLGYFDVATAAQLEVYSFGNSVCWTQGSTGSWSDTTTRYPMIGPVISAITEPAGGSGAYVGTHQLIGLGR